MPCFDSNCLFSSLFLLFCIAGTISQLGYLILSYFRHEYHTIINMEIPDDTYLPDVSVCFEILFMINYTKLYEAHPSVYGKLFESIKPKLSLSIDDPPEPAENFREILFANLKPNDVIFMVTENLTVSQVNKLLFHRDDIVKTIKLWTRDEKKDSKQACEIKEYFKDYSMCYVFACSRDHPVTFSVSDREKSPMSNPLFSIVFDQSILKFLPRFYVTLLKPNTEPRGQMLKWVSYTTEKKSKKFMVSFYEFHSILLPPPYPTMCRDYAEEGFKSRIQYRDECMNNRSLDELGVPFLSSAISPNTSKIFAFVKYMQQTNESYQDKIEEIVNHCDSLTQEPDCDSRFYITQRREPELLFQNESTLVIDQIRQPNITILFKEKTSIYDCLILIGSVLGNWFGFAIYPHLPILLTYASEWRLTKNSSSGKSSHLGKIMPKNQKFSGHQNLRNSLSCPAKTRDWKFHNQMNSWHSNSNKFYANKSELID